MRPALHFYESRAWNNPEGDAPPEGWFIVDDDYPLHIYPILAGPFDDEREAARVMHKLEAHK